MTHPKIVCHKTSIHTKKSAPWCSIVISLRLSKHVLSFARYCTCPSPAINECEVRGRTQVNTGRFWILRYNFQAMQCCSQSPRNQPYTWRRLTVNVGNTVELRQGEWNPVLSSLRGGVGSLCVYVEQAVRSAVVTACLEGVGELSSSVWKSMSNRSYEVNCCD
jgi:hypothetical protein